MFAISTKKNIRFPRVKGIKISSSFKANAATIYNGNSSVDIDFFFYIIELIKFLNLESSIIMWSV